MASDYTISMARPEHVASIPAIERDAAQLLAGHAPAAVLNETTSEDDLKQAQQDGRLWVVLADGAAVGFAHGGQQRGAMRRSA